MGIIIINKNNKLQKVINAKTKTEALKRMYDVLEIDNECELTYQSDTEQELFKAYQYNGEVRVSLSGEQFRELLNVVFQMNKKLKVALAEINSLKEGDED